MNTFFRELFQYNNHCNQKLIEAFLEYSDNANEKSVKLFNHILNVHQIWNGRIEGNQNLYAIWEIHLQQEYKQIDNSNTATIKIQLLSLINLI